MASHLRMTGIADDHRDGKTLVKVGISSTSGLTRMVAPSRSVFREHRENFFQVEGA